MVGEEVDGAAHVTLGLIHVEGHHLLLGLVGLGGRLSAVEVGRQRQEAVGGQAIAHRADVVLQAPPLLEHHHRQAVAVLGDREVAGGRRAVGGKGHVGHAWVRARCPAL
jgi:hypothetical protein